MSNNAIKQEFEDRLRRATDILSFSDHREESSERSISIKEEYRRALASVVKDKGRKSISASVDQMIAGMLKFSGRSIREIEEVIEQYSPMAVRPTLQQRQSYAKAVVQRSRPHRKIERSRQHKENKIYEMSKEECFFVRPKTSSEKIGTAIASLMKTSEGNILLFNSDKEEIPKLDRSILYLIDYSTANGDFPTFITIYPQYPVIDARPLHDPERLRFMNELCVFLSCEALIEYGDEPKLEEGWMLLNGQDHTLVSLDSDKIVDEGSFVIRKL